MSTKTVLVTDGIEGLGLAVSKLLSQGGFKVIATHSASEQKVIDEANGVLGNCELIEVDFSNAESISNFFKSVENQKFDAIVNNASFFDFENFQNFNFDIWDKTFLVNLRAPLEITHRLKNQINDNGAIVNITTTDAFAGAYASSAWAASKAAIINLTKSMANNLGSRGIRANAVAVGWVGNLEDLGDADVQAESINITPLGRLGTQEEIANVVEFLVSDKASYVNASTVVVDGGYTAVDIIGKKEAETL